MIYIILLLLLFYLIYRSQSVEYMLPQGPGSTLVKRPHWCISLSAVLASAMSEAQTGIMLPKNKAQEMWNIVRPVCGN